ncbi:MAG: hypothetical protein J6I47_08585 [Ruminococcus sp.]|nr:hypothetical protein [Ruminococcus sp.]
MRKIFRTNLQLGIFIAALVMTLLAAFLAVSNTEIDNDWVNSEYEDYAKEPDSFTVVKTPIRGFKTLNGSNYSPLRYVDFFRVCVVEVTFAGGQKMEYYVARSSEDKEGDLIEVAYPKHWDTDYNKIMKASDVSEDTRLMAARTTEVSDGLYSRLFCVIATVSGVFSAVVFFICYKKRNAYEL